MQWVWPMLLLALLVPLLYTATRAGTTFDLLVALAVVVGIGGVAGLLPRDRRRPNPFAVYAALVATVAAALGFVWLVSWLDPVLLLAATVALALITLAAWYRRGEGLRRERAVSGLCETCGYDLRSSADVCPECGSPLPEELLRRRRIADTLAAEQEARSPEARTKPPGR